MAAEARNLVEAIHLSAVLNVSNMLHEDKQPIGRQQSKYNLPSILNRASENLENAEV